MVGTYACSLQNDGAHKPLHHICASETKYILKYLSSEFKDYDYFFDLTVKQVNKMRAPFQSKTKVILMKSFSSSVDNDER